MLNKSLREITVICLPIMQVRPCGQKKPSQQGRQLTVLNGVLLESLRLTFVRSGTVHAQPGSHPETHEVKLQFALGGRKLCGPPLCKKLLK